MCTKFGIYHPLRTLNSLWSQNVEIYNPTWPPAAILKFAKNLNNSGTVSPILTKFDTELQLDTVQTPGRSKPPFFKNARWPPTKS